MDSREKVAYPPKNDEGEVLGDREKEGLPSKMILNYMTPRKEKKEEGMWENYGCAERRGEVRAYISRGKTLWREKVEEMSKRGQAGHQQGEERRHYWGMREDIEVKIGRCEGETRERKK